MDSKKKWRNKARAYLAEAFGGKCTVCGYDRCISALDYHHLDPTEKDSQLSLGMKNGAAWSKIVEEARKCTLICCRCHREYHAGFIELPENPVRFNEDYADVIKLRKKEFNECPVCGEEKNILRRHCSKKCQAKKMRKFEITKEELEKLVNELPYTKIGEMFDVSGRTIKKRCELLGVEVGPRRGYWSKK